MATVDGAPRGFSPRWSSWGSRPERAVRDCAWSVGSRSLPGRSVAPTGGSVASAAIAAGRASARTIVCAQCASSVAAGAFVITGGSGTRAGSAEAATYASTAGTAGSAKTAAAEAFANTGGRSDNAGNVAVLPSVSTASTGARA